MDLKAQLLAAATKYSAQNGKSLARIATIVVNDGKFFKRIQNGGGFTVKTYDKFMKYFGAKSSGNTADQLHANETAAPGNGGVPSEDAA